MSLWSAIKSFFSTTGTISDEEVASKEWVLCPKCNVYIEKEVLEDEDYVCPNCHTQIIKE